MDVKIIDDVYHLSGDLNESSDFSPLAFASSPIQIDWSKIDRINSLGLRSLITFIKSCVDKKIDYINCPPVFIDQLNMVPSLIVTEGVEIVVKSAVVPMVCDSCGHLDESLKPSSDFQSIRSGNASASCSQCGDVMHLEFSEYLDFIDHK